MAEEPNKAAMPSPPKIEIFWNSSSAPREEKKETIILEDMRPEAQPATSIRVTARLMRWLGAPLDKTLFVIRPVRLKDGRKALLVVPEDEL